MMTSTQGKPRILVLNATCLDVVEEHRAWIEEQGAALVAEQEFRGITQRQMAELLRDTDAAILPAPHAITPAMMAASPRLKVLSIAASGYDWLDMEAATSCGIVVTNAPVREGAEVVADMAWALMLTVARRIPFHHQAIRERRPQEMNLNILPRGIGASVWGKTLGIIGLGQIGKAVARRACGFEMRVLAATPRANETFAKCHNIEIVSLDELLQQSDFVSLHARLNPQTENMIGARELSLMKPSAFLINTARRQLADEAALTQAIMQNRIAGAALDDPPQDASTPLLDLPNVVFSTHLGNRAREGMHAVFRCALQNAVSILRGEETPFILNPEVRSRSKTGKQL